MASVVALIADLQQRARLREVLRGRATITFPRTAAELLDLISVAQPAAVIIGLRNGVGQSHVGVISELRARSGALPIFAYCRLDHEDVQDLVQAARAGIDEVLLYGASDEWIVLGAIPGATASERIAHRVWRAADHVVPYPAKAIFRYALSHVHPRATVADVASALGIHRKTLAERMEHARLPAPSEIISWSRLLYAAYVLDEAECSVEGAAYRAGFNSAAALRSMLKRYSGLRPDELRRQGGFSYLVSQFDAALNKRAALCATSPASVEAIGHATEAVKRARRRAASNEGWNVA